MAIKEEISEILMESLAKAKRENSLPSLEFEDASMERPQNTEHGDFASSIALKLARPMRMNPMEIANHIAEGMRNNSLLDNVSVIAPGFINITLNEDWLRSQINVILEKGSTFGSTDIGHGQKVQIEFVSANPVGPLHVAHARGGVIGSAIANILEAANYNVSREYYFNDAGAQISHFNETLWARYQQLFQIVADVPEDGYKGAYMVEMAQTIKDEYGDVFLQSEEIEASHKLGQVGLEKFMESIKTDVGLLRISFDSWFNEASLYQQGQFEKAMSILTEKGYVEKHDGATWFASSKLGDEKDKVLIRSNGIPTYFASDVAYHYNKFFERNYDKVINIWGADHQGHASFMKAIIKAFELPEENLSLIINQLVTLKRGGEIVRISKRTGDIVTLRDVVEEVGPDACRFFFLSRDANSQMDFDLELAVKESQENPVYYIQYAHARIASILRLAEDRKINYSDGILDLLTHESELSLIRKMLIFPEIVELITRTLEPHHIAHYSIELATAFHWMYQNCRVVSSLPEDEALTKSRLKLVEAAMIVLSRCLDLMSMDAPNEM